MEKRQAQQILDRCRDPLFFSEKVLGGALWEKQKEILLTLKVHNRVTVRSCNGIGKTWCAARAALWFLYCHKPSLVITTAPTWTSVATILWERIKQQFHGSLVPLGGELLETQIKVGDGWYAMGLSTNEAEKFQGRHETNILFIFDEAPGIRPAIFEATEGSMTSENARWLMIGNPLSPSGFFYDSFQSPLWHPIHISAYDCPNVKEKRIVIPGLTTYGWVKEREEEWGINHPLFQSRVLGNFPSEGKDTLIGLTVAQEATIRDLLPSGPKVMAIDVARFGDNETVFCIQQGRKVLHMEATSGRDTMQVTGEAIRLRKLHGVEQMGVDVIGIGCFDDQTDILTDAGWKRFKCLNKKERVLTVNPENMIAEYVKPTKYYEKRYKGKMHLREGQTVNFCLTPNHRMYFKGERGNIWRFSEVSKLPLKGIRMKRNFGWQGMESNEFVLAPFDKGMFHGGSQHFDAIKLSMDWWLEFLGWYFSEGSTHRLQYAVAISQQKKDNRERIKSLLEKGPFHFSEKKDCYKINSKQLFDYLSQFGKQPIRTIPVFIKQLSSRQIRIFLDSFLLGDGYEHKGMKCYVTSSPRLADDLQELILKTGNYASISFRKTKGQRVWIKDHWAIRTTDSYTIYEWLSPVEIVLKTKSIKKINYDGKVYCVEAPPFNLIYVRRKGKCFWSGNSGVADRLREQQQKVFDVNVAEAPSKDDFLNLRAEMYWGLAQDFRSGNISIPDDRKLLSQLTSIKYGFDSRGKIKIEGKDEMAKRGVKSPDWADALAISNWLSKRVFARQKVGELIGMGEERETTMESMRW